MTSKRIYLPKIPEPITDQSMAIRKEIKSQKLLRVITPILGAMLCAVPFAMIAGNIYIIYADLPVQLLVNGSLIMVLSAIFITHYGRDMFRLLPVCPRGLDEVPDSLVAELEEDQKRHPELNGTLREISELGRKPNEREYEAIKAYIETKEG